MICLQISIGTVNDIVDIEHDRGAKPAKPLPRGLIGRPAAWLLAALGLLAGLGLSALIEPRAALVAIVGVGLGYAYDLRLKVSPWSWLPFALGIGLLPVYAWLGATGSIPAAFGLLLPMATLAGASLALANQLADDERDRQEGLRTAVGSLGRARAWALSASLDAVVGLIALASLVIVSAPALAIAGADLSVALVAVGLSLGRSRLPSTRERAWEIQALAFACLAVAWLAGLANQGLLRA
jgi:4-hydroxybenzoate polyprenyltransferase